MERAGMQEFFGEVRAYFAAVNRSTETGAVFDPSLGFDLKNPPAPWVSLGLVRNFKRLAKVSLGTVRSGMAGVAQAQYRKQTDARVSLDFCEWGKLQMALAASSQHLNVLESAGTMAKASGGAAKPGQPILVGSSEVLILLDGSVLSNYSVGQWIVVDVDYVSGMSEMGTGVTGSVVETSATMDSDAVRRVSYNVGCVAAIVAEGLVLNAPLLGGTPAPGARLQKVVAFVDHEGANFFQEWSAVFALEEVSGGKVYFYYPRLQAASPAEETVAAVGSELSMSLLHAEFAAMAAADANDGESVVCYRSYVPAAGTPAY